MTERGIRRWALLGALVSTALLAPACGRSIPRAGSENEGVVNEAQKVEPVGAAQEQQATGGSGFQSQEQQAAPMFWAGEEQPIGAPGYSTPHENLYVSPMRIEPHPSLREQGGSYRSAQKLYRHNELPK